MVDRLHEQKFSGLLTTLDATLTEIISYTLPKNTPTVAQLEFDLLGLKSDRSVGARYFIIASFKVDAGTAVTQLSTDTLIQVVEDDATWGYDISISGDTVSLSVVGKALTEIAWIAFVTARLYTP